MAVEPLYNDKDVLLQRLRMQETSDVETLTVIDQVIKDVRLEFYRRVGLSRATDIAAITTEENPTTEDGVLRGIAEVAEIYWVMYKLVCILPVMYIETQFAIKNNFDDVPIVRDADSLANFKQALKNSVELNLGLLIDPVNENTGSVKSFSAGRMDIDGNASPYILNDHFVGLPRSYTSGAL